MWFRRQFIKYTKTYSRADKLLKFKILVNSFLVDKTFATLAEQSVQKYLIYQGIKLANFYFLAINQ